MPTEHSDASLLIQNKNTLAIHATAQHTATQWNNKGIQSIIAAMKTKKYFACWQEKLVNRLRCCCTP
jgi:hypothetical protein